MRVQYSLPLCSPTTADPRPLSREELTKIQSPDAFRRASQKKHANRHPSPDFADQQECHKVPNSLLYKAFAQTTDPEIQKLGFDLIVVKAYHSVTAYFISHGCLLPVYCFPANKHEVLGNFVWFLQFFGPHLDHASSDQE